MTVPVIRPSANKPAIILEMAAEAGIELDPDNPWKTLDELFEAHITLARFAAFLKCKPDDVPARVEKLIKKIGREKVLKKLSAAGLLSPLP